MERRVVARARLTVVSTDGAARRLGEDHALDHTPFVYRPFVPSEQLPEDVHLAVRDPGRALVVHAGSLYQGRRSAEPVVEAMRRQKHEIAWEFRYFGDCPEGVVHGARAVCGVTETYGGRVSREEAAAHLMAADAILVLVWTGEDGEDHTIPGKLYEAVSLRKPVLVFGRQSDEIRAVLQQAGAYAEVTDDPHLAAQFLNAAVRGKRTLRSQLPQDCAFSSQLARLLESTGID
jgi:hypothetical protein